MSYLVTGGTGFIGSHLVELLLEKGKEVRVPVRESSSLKWLPVGHPNLVLLKCDLFKKEDRKRALKDVSIVFHLAGLTKAPDWKSYRRINYELVRLLYQSAVDSGTVKKFVFTGSQAARGPSPAKIGLKENEIAGPVSDYGKSKRLAARYLKRKNEIPSLIIYPPSVYGPRDKDIFVYFKLINSNISPFIGHRHRFFDIIYVKDLVKAMEIISRVETKVTLEINISNGKAYSWQRLSKEISIALNKKPVKIYVPVILLKAAGILIEIFCKIFKRAPLLNRQKIKEMLSLYWLLDSGLLKEQFGFEEEFGLTKGIKQTGDWYIKQGWIKGE